MTISRCRNCASQRFLPAFVTSRQSAPSTTLASPAPGALNDGVHGKLTPPSNVPFASKLCGLAPVSALAPAALDMRDGGSKQPTPCTSAQPTRISAAAQRRREMVQKQRLAPASEIT